MPLKRSLLEEVATGACSKVSALVAIAASGLMLCGPAGNTIACAQAQKSKGQNTGNTQSVDRGKYLVEGVAMCGQCHTPRDSNGNSERTRRLQGAPVPWLPAKPD